MQLCHTKSVLTYCNSAVQLDTSHDSEAPRLHTAASPHVGCEGVGEGGNAADQTLYSPNVTVCMGCNLA